MLRNGATGEDQIGAIHERFEFRREHARSVRGKRQQKEGTTGCDKRTPAVKQFMTLHARNLAAERLTATILKF